MLAVCFLGLNCGSGAHLVARGMTKPLNVILLIGDGMGLAQISAAAVLNGGLSLDLFRIIGLLRTSSASDYITDSAAGATAFSCGIKTYNGAIGVNPDTLQVSTLLELAEKKGMSTGLVVSSSITHATPASFFAHQKDRELHLQIAGDFYGKGIDFAAGGGKPFFSMEKLKQDGYFVHTGNIGPSEPINSSKLCWFYSDSTEVPAAKIRGNWIERASAAALDHLKTNRNGFFLMIEGSQIDWGGHNNDLDYTLSELIDFDRAVRLALDFAKTNGNTLVIVTADHETGGLSLPAGNLKDKKVEGMYATTHHTGIMVPVYAFGPGAEAFSGTQENTAVFHHITELLNLK